MIQTEFCANVLCDHNKVNLPPFSGDRMELPSGKQIIRRAYVRREPPKGAFKRILLCDVCAHAVDMFSHSITPTWDNKEQS